MARFITRPLLFLTPLVLLVGLGVYVDPLDRFGGWRPLPPVNANYRQVKLADYLERSPRDYDALVLGSSRVMRLRGEYFADYGYHSFNFGFNMARLEDLYCTLRLVLEHNRRRLRLVVIGLEPEMFHDRLGLHKQTLQLDELAAYLPPQLELPAAGPGDTLKLLSDSTRLAFLALRLHLAGEEPGVEFALEPTTGDYVVKPPPEDGIRVNPNILQTMHGIYSGFEEFSPARVELFRRLVDLCAAADIRLVCFNTTNHPVLQNFLEQTTGLAVVEELQRELCASVDYPGFTYLDLGSVEAFGGDPDDFSDVAHIGSGNARLVVRRLLEAAPAPAEP